MNDYDVLIAGSGVAGLYAALNFDPTVRVLVLSKKELTLCNSFLAQGGVDQRRLPPAYCRHPDRGRL